MDLPNNRDNPPPRASHPLPPSSVNLTASSTRKITLPERKLPSPPDSTERTRPLAGGLPQLLQDFKGMVEAGEAGPWTVIPLSVEDFAKYRQEIESTFRRFDYESHKGQITIRMPGPVHEGFLSDFEFDLRTAMSILGVEQQNTPTGRFIEQIGCFRSADIKLKNNTDKYPTPSQSTVDTVHFQRSPDAQFFLRSTGLSGVVVKVAYTQTGKELREHQSAE